MKYYSVWSIVFKIEDEANYRHIVDKARFLTNTSDRGIIMMEDINRCEVEDYVLYLEEQLREANNKILKKNKRIAELTPTKDNIF